MPHIKENIMFKSLFANDSLRVVKTIKEEQKNYVKKTESFKLTFKR